MQYVLNINICMQYVLNKNILKTGKYQEIMNKNHARKTDVS